MLVCAGLERGHVTKILRVQNVLGIFEANQLSRYLRSVGKKLFQSFLTT